MNCVLAFTVRNIEPYEKRLEKFLSSIQEIFKGIKIVATCSDANKSSQLAIARIANNYNFFSYQYLGDLRKQHKSYDMTSNRVAKGRNEYLKVIRIINPEVVIMVDCDNRLPTGESINEYQAILKQYYRYLASNMCDGIFANTIGNYYDIWALRSKECPYDCHKEIKKAVNNGETLENAQYKYLRKHQKVIKTDDFITVNSAFGGFAMYNWKSISKLYYCGMEFVNQNYSMVCEHPYFNEQINNARLYISGRLKIVPGNNDLYEPMKDN